MKHSSHLIISGLLACCMQINAYIDLTGPTARRHIHIHNYSKDLCNVIFGFTEGKKTNVVVPSGQTVPATIDPRKVRLIKFKFFNKKNVSRVKLGAKFIKQSSEGTAIPDLKKYDVSIKTEHTPQNK